MRSLVTRFQLVAVKRPRLVITLLLLVAFVALSGGAAALDGDPVGPTDAGSGSNGPQQPEDG